jgi:cytochrome c oxidase assembly protein subunit 15
MILWLSFGSLILIYSVMLLGIYITASHQGLSCPGWPLCPNGFNFPPPKYFFEHVHRSMAIVAACVIFTTMFYAIKRTKNVRKTAIAASIVVLIQILLGMIVVNSKLEALLVATHLSTGVILFAMILVTFLSSYQLTKIDSNIR